jgi:DNA-binding NarL/FixJ family response regulator
MNAGTMRRIQPILDKLFDGADMNTGVARRILLVDDHAAIRQGLAQVLTEDGVGECREAGGRKDALEAAEREPPDLALVDLSLATGDALQLVAEFSARNIPVLVCSAHEEAGYVCRALAAGTRGYITKREAPRELARTVRDVLDGWTLISPHATEGLH